MPATADRLYLGDRIGNYRVELELGSDEKSATYRAAHLVLPRKARIKLLDGAQDQPLIVHVLREACLLDALHHPGIVRVYESGLHEGRPWFATELVEAGSIKAQLEPGAIDRIEAIALLRDVAHVLEHAFRRGVIHCGLRPERILLTGRTRAFPICVVGWSDARLHDAAPQPFAPSAAAWHYTAPELASGDTIDDRTDVFALGVIAYQMLTGQVPFEGGILSIVHDGTLQHVPTAILAPDLPPELTRLVDSMLAYERWDRPAIGEVLAELTWISEAAEIDAPAPIAASGPIRIRRPRWTPPIAFERAPLLPEIELGAVLESLEPSEPSEPGPSEDESSS